ncbi:MAG: HNH endonuclease, partial [Jatrophihabitantaceae bacterium]
MYASRLSDAGLIDALIASERQLALLQAKQQEFLAEAARRDPDGELYFREEVACALRLAPVTAQDRLDTAAQLTSRLWDTRELMDAGR